MQPNNGHEESLEPLSLVESLKCQGLQKRPSGGMRSTKYPSATPTSILLPHLPICLFNYYNITVVFFAYRNNSSFGFAAEVDLSTLLLFSSGTFYI